MIHKRSSRPVTLFLLASLWTVGAVRAQIDIGDFESVVQAEIRDNGVPGAAVALVTGDRIVLAKGFGVASLETGQPVTPDTLFHLGSITKTLTAVAAVILAEQGKIKLDEPVGRWVEGLPPSLAKLTLHQLLTQTGGLRDSPGGDGLHEESALGEFLRTQTGDAALFEPGRAFSYSNIGYALAGYSLEKATGKPYADVMRETLFEPLGMTRTTLRPLEAITWPVAVGHEPQESGPPKVVRPMVDDTRIWPAGYAFSSLNDLSRLLVALLNGGRLEGKQVLPAGAVEKLLEPRVEIPTNTFFEGRYGYGLFFHEGRGERIALHAGTLTGFSSEIRMIPGRRSAVILLTNRGDNRMEKSFTRALDLLLPGVTPPKTAARRELKMSAEEMQRYVGTYDNRWPMDIFVREGRLYLRRFGDELPITRIGENRFSVQPEGAPQPQEFAITPGADGRPELLQMFLWAFKRTDKPASGS